MRKNGLFWSIQAFGGPPDEWFGLKHFNLQSATIHVLHNLYDALVSGIKNQIYEFESYLLASTWVLLQSWMEAAFPGPDRPRLRRTTTVPSITWKLSWVGFWWPDFRHPESLGHQFCCMVGFPIQRQDFWMNLSQVLCLSLWTDSQIYGGGGEHKECLHVK